MFFKKTVKEIRAEIEAHNVTFTTHQSLLAPLISRLYCVVVMSFCIWRRCVTISTQSVTDDVIANLIISTLEHEGLPAQGDARVLRCINKK